MKVNQIKLVNFRNYEYAEIDGLSDKINIFVGENAQGKTNLIEAINYFSIGKSFKNISDMSLIRQGSEHAYLSMKYVSSINKYAQIYILPDSKKIIKLDGLGIKKLSELFGNLNTVIFSPEDLKTIKESPGLRRKFIDMEICKVRPSHYIYLQNYMQVLKNKNKALKIQSDKKLIEVYNEQLCELAASLISKRINFLDMLQKRASEIHSILTGGQEKLSIKYKTCADVSNIKNSLLKKLEAMYKRECAMGQTLIGPHRDDIEIYINDMDSKLYASQGQQRTAMFSLKLAVVDMIHDISGQKPVLLLDDVFSELDMQRKNKIIEILNDVQVFITTVDSNLNLKDCSIYEISKACIRQI